MKNICPLTAEDVGGDAAGAESTAAAAAAAAPAADAPKDPQASTAAPVKADAETEDDGEDFALLGALFSLYTRFSKFHITILNFLFGIGLCCF